MINSVSSCIVVNVDSEIKLRQLSVVDSRALFNLIECNRNHLDQFGNRFAAKHADLSSVIEDLNHPLNLEKLKMGIWSSDDLAGCVFFTPQICRSGELGYYLGKDFTGRNIMARSILAFANYLFASQDLRELYAVVEASNTASRRVLERTGFSHSTFVKRGFIHYSIKSPGLRSQAAYLGESWY
jgi:ribosomal-protein-serine acetyltransferase